MSDIFISYSRKDKPWVEKLASSLEAEGYDVWWDPEILPGQDFETIIRQALEGAKCVITVWSQSSISSDWVKEESSYALERKVLVPVLYQAIKPPMPFGRIHTADLQGWKGKTSDPRYQQLLRAIAVHCPVDLVAPPSHQSSTTTTKKPWLGIASGLLLLGVAGYLGLSYLSNDGNSNTQGKQSVLMANVDQADIQNQEIDQSNKVAIEAASQSKNIRIGQYIDHGDGTVTDTKTKLMWKKCPEGQSGINCGQGKAKEYTWDDAMKKSENVELAGYRDWRVPTKEELRSLVYCSNGVSQQEAWDENCDGKNDDQGEYYRPTINLRAFPKTHSGYWSSSPSAGNSNLAWIIHFNYGGGLAYLKSNSLYVLLVRSGQ